MKHWGGGGSSDPSPTAFSPLCLPLVPRTGDSLDVDKTPTATDTAIVAYCIDAAGPWCARRHVIDNEGRPRRNDADAHRPPRPLRPIRQRHRCCCCCQARWRCCIKLTLSMRDRACRPRRHVINIEQGRRRKHGLLCTNQGDCRRASGRVPPLQQ